MNTVKDAGMAATATATMSGLQRHLESGRFTVTAEVSPPVSADPAAFLAAALPLKGLATALNVTDGASAKVHMSSLAAAHFLLANGIEPVLQVALRDRNRIALQSDLLGAAALGIRNILVVRGDDPSAGDHPEAKPVYDISTQELIALANHMRRDGRLSTGTPIAGGIRLYIGAADTTCDPPAGWAPVGLQAKRSSGADFAQTQFCMDAGVARRYAARLLELGIAPALPVLIGVAPIPSARSARWMRDKLPGSVIPDALIERLEKSSDPKAEGKRICVELLQELAGMPGVAGAHIMAPQFHSAIAEVIAESGVTAGQDARRPR
jgi:methylenetetrahydrofolate reductase (NADPH)